MPRVVHAEAQVHRRVVDQVGLDAEAFQQREEPTAITQNIKDLLASREVENIFENSDFVLMLNQAQGDRAILAKQLNISPQQMKYVTHTEAGEGLISVSYTHLFTALC